MSYLDRLKHLEDQKIHDTPTNTACQNCQNPLFDSFGSFGSTDSELYAKNLSANGSQSIAESVVVDIATTQNLSPNRQEWKPDRCNRCIHLSHFHGGNACRADNGLPHLFGLLYNVSDDNGATCAAWQAD